MRGDVEGGRLKKTEEGERDLAEIRFDCPRAMFDEFELWCREHDLDFDETIQKMIDIALKRLSKQVSKDEEMSLVE